MLQVHFVSHIRVQRVNKYYVGIHIPILHAPNSTFTTHFTHLRKIPLRHCLWYLTPLLIIRLFFSLSVLFFIILTCCLYFIVSSAFMMCWFLKTQPQTSSLCLSFWYLVILLLLLLMMLVVLLLLLYFLSFLIIFMLSAICKWRNKQTNKKNMLLLRIIQTQK